MVKYILLAFLTCTSLITYASEKEQNFLPLEELPILPLTKVMSYLNVKDAISLAKTNKFFKKSILNEDSIYRHTTQNNLLNINSEKFSKLPKYCLKWFIGQVSIKAEYDYPWNINLDLSEMNICKNLKSLKFSGRTICLERKSLGNLGKKLLWGKEIQSIHLKGNNLNSIGNKFIETEWPANLVTLGLQDNNLGKLGENFSNLKFNPTLQDLRLVSNDLGSLKENFLSIPWPVSLTNLDLGDNELSDLGINNFLEIKWPENLKCLGLQYNNLSDLGDDLILLELPESLEYLNIEGNNINEETKKQIKLKYQNVNVTF